ncbi:hypothetical protein PLICRDRAFT_304969 [Plicaturopsis crispa FD-325 SS-3]|nr:hypothetical protein PLICRDRAFT_304969 [Plicaturopsis crispa FD-325 SS-3]
MLPFTDIHFVACGIAGFAATLGYSYAKRSRMSRRRPAFERERRLRAGESRSSTPSTSSDDSSIDTPDEPSPAVGVEAVALASDSFDYAPAAGEPVSLKRKASEDHDVFGPIPKKRSKTPPRGNNGEQALESLSPSPDGGVPSPTPSIEINEGPAEATNVSDVVNVEENVVVVPTISNEEATEAAPAPSTPYTPPSPEVPAPAPSHGTAQTPHSPAQSPIRGFASFAGADSPYSSMRRNSAPTPGTQRPAWASNGESSNMNAFGSVALEEGEIASSSPLGSHGDLKPALHCSTGEEHEDVKSELKGVKLFVKRGKKDFTTGMVGTVKLLVHRDTREERLLFRREPLWKVSLNVRLQPLVRCTYDRDERILRVALKEPVEGNGLSADGGHELVVYALKPGRASKDEFRDFADALLKNEHLVVPAA